MAYIDNCYPCAEPTMENLNYRGYFDDLSSSISDISAKNDTAWCLLKTLSPILSKKVPTWTAYNSLLAEKAPITTVSMLPVINGSPTLWENLYTAIKNAQDIKNDLYPNSKTIVSFDLQLYIKAIKLQSSRPDVQTEFVFRIGELHVVFCVLKVLGKMINGSGLDQVFEEAGIYGPTTISQIKDGKHMYRSLEAHFTLYLSLYKLYIEKFFQDNQDVKNYLTEGVVDSITNLTDYNSMYKDEIRSNHDMLKNKLDLVDIKSLLNDFDGSLSNQTKFYRNYMLLFESLLMFIRASREQSWELHLNSLSNLCPYFFAFDMLNYARMTPVYLSQMYALRKNDETTWNILNNGHFSVNKTIVPFSAIGADHGIEQENRALKVLGGIKGLSNCQHALSDYFLTAAELGNIVEDFCDKFSLKDKQYRKRDEHYQLTGSKRKRINENIEKILSVFTDHNVSFESCNTVYNIVTKKILPSQFATKFLAAKSIGKQRYKNFVQERLIGNTSIWELLGKEKLPTFSDNSKFVTINVNKQLIQVREERKLMTRLLIASRSRPDIDLPSKIGAYEFSVVPRSLFTADGSLYQTSDKAVIAEELRKLQCDDENEQENVNIDRKVIIFDGMAVVNRIDIKKNKVANCLQYANCFYNIITRESREMDEIRIVFDRYDDKSLKSKTRCKRTGNVSVQYKITDSTQIGHLTTKQFLSSTKTKSDLIAYICEKGQHLIQKDYVLVFENTCLSNLIDLDPDLKIYTHEEADTGIVLHAIDVCSRDPLVKLIISCSDTDVLLILLYYYEKLNSSTEFKTLKHVMNLKRIHDSIGPKVAKALIGFHAMSGCDQTGKFHGFSKLACWKAFMLSSDKIKEGFVSLGETPKPTEAVTAMMEQFVIQLYTKKKTTSVEKLEDLRWYLFSKQQLEGQSLPPTRAALSQKVLRAHYTALQWKSSHLASPYLPDPTEFGWYWESNAKTYEPTMTTLPPAPESVIDLSMCHCKTKCTTLRCKCKKNALVCSEMCLCIDCMNTNEIEDKNIEGCDSDSEEEI